MYRTFCVFYPGYVNPFTGRKGRYLVSHCSDNRHGLYNKRPSKTYRPLLCDYVLAITTLERKRAGCVINPTAELKKLIEAGRPK